MLTSLHCMQSLNEEENYTISINSHSSLHSSVYKITLSTPIIVLKRASETKKSLHYLIVKYLKHNDVGISKETF